jgi:hypothetical protein
VNGALRRGAANPYLRSAFFFGLAIAAKWGTLAKAGYLNDFRDSQYFTLFEEAARISVAKFHQLPLWDPYYCGGISGLGTPSARFVSPTFLLTLAFGTLRADALIAMAMAIVGLEGTFRYLRARGAGAAGAMLAAPIFALSGVFAHTPTLGWTNFFGFELVPWALLGIREALRGSRRGVVIAALAVSWMVGFGGTYTGPLTVLAASFEVMEALVDRARRPKAMGYVLSMGLLVVILAAALSLVRLWPVAETLSASPRIIGGTPGETPRRVWELLFGDRGRRFSRGDFLIGLPVVPLIVLGSGRKRSLWFTFSGLIWVWLALGFKAPGSPTTSLFALLRVVPPYTMLRAPERFLVFFALVAAGVAALGLRRLEVGARKKRAFVVSVAIGQALLLWSTTILIINDHFEARGRTMVPAPPTISREFHQSRGNRWLAAYYPWMSRGTLSCFDDYDIAQSPELRGDLEHEAYLDDPSAGSVVSSHWSPNRLDLHTELTRPARVIVNQNWHPGWSSSVGNVISSDGLLAVDLPEGAHDLTLRFLPRSAVGGIGTFMVGLAVAVVLWRRSRRGDTVTLGRDWLFTAGLCLLPFSAAALTLALVPETKRPPPSSLTPSGEPMVVDSAPAAASPVDAQWSDGITLEAAEIHIEPSDDEQGRLATLELDWRVDRKLPAGLGIFVHFETNPKDRFSADHVLLSATMLLDDAPLHKTIRDVSAPIVVSLGKTPETWKVHVGIWRARRDQSRVSVDGYGRNGGEDNRVLVGTFDVPAKEQKD